MNYKPFVQLDPIDNFTSLKVDGYSVRRRWLSIFNIISIQTYFISHVFPCYGHALYTITFLAVKRMTCWALYALLRPRHDQSLAQKSAIRLASLRESACLLLVWILILKWLCIFDLCQDHYQLIIYWSSCINGHSHMRKQGNDRQSIGQHDSASCENLALRMTGHKIYKMGLSTFKWSLLVITNTGH